MMPSTRGSAERGSAASDSGLLALTGNRALSVPPRQLADCAQPNSPLLGAPGAQFTANFPARPRAPFLGPLGQASLSANGISAPKTEVQREYDTVLAELEWLIRAYEANQLNRNRRKWRWLATLFAFAPRKRCCPDDLLRVPDDLSVLP
jgi:hypothetical protein